MLTRGHPSSQTGGPPLTCATPALGVADDVFDDRRRRYGWGTRQVHDLTDVVQEIKFALPVIAHHENVGLVFQDVLTFLFEAFFDEDVVDPLGMPLESYRAIAWELDQWIGRLLNGLYGPAAVPEASGES